MRQLILDLLPETCPALDNFVVGEAGGNAETLAAFTTWLAGQSSESSFCLWGEPGAGKSHLLLASGLLCVDAAADPALASLDGGTPEWLAVDQVDQLDAQGQIALFNHFNHIRRVGGRLLTAAPQAPAHLSLREDLRSRLGWGLIYRLTPLSDQDKSAALAAQAKARGMKLAPETIDYLLRHVRRDMRTLSACIVALDRYTLEHKRPVTLPLLRELLAQPQEPKA